MPNFGLWEWVVVLVIVGSIGLLVSLLPWVVAEFIKSVKQHL